MGRDIIGQFSLLPRCADEEREPGGLLNFLKEEESEEYDEEKEKDDEEKEEDDKEKKEDYVKEMEMEEKRRYEEDMQDSLVVEEVNSSSDPFHLSPSPASPATGFFLSRRS